LRPGWTAMIDIIDESIGQTRQAYATIYIPRIEIGQSYVATKKTGLLHHRDLEKTWRTKIAPELERVERHNAQFSEDLSKIIDAIVFPELSIPANLVLRLRGWSKSNRVIVIAGSHYKSNNEAWCSVCPVIIDGAEYETFKAVPSPFEDSGLSDHGLKPGPFIRRFRRTRIGNFCVLICSDYLDRRTRDAVVDDETDLVFVIACQKDTTRHYANAVDDCHSSARGLYVVFSNLRFGQFGSGNSALFAQVHKDFEGHFKRLNYSDLIPKEKVWQSSNVYPSAIVRLDLNDRRPTIPKTARTRTNVVITMPFDYEAPGSGIVKNAADPRAYKLIAFDLDGTLLRGAKYKYSWAAVWERLAGDSDGMIWRGHMRRFLRKEIDYIKWCDIAAEAFRKKQITNSQMIGLAKEFSLVRNCKEVLFRLKAEGYKLVLLSGGIDIFLRAHFTKREVEAIFDIVKINVMAFDVDNVVAYVKATSYDYEGKMRAISEICHDEGVSLEDVLYVGDSINDRYLLNTIGCFISVEGSDEEISLTSNYHVAGADLEEVYRIVQQGKVEAHFGDNGGGHSQLDLHW
jgi:phosphoserine phosphatase